MIRSSLTFAILTTFLAACSDTAAPTDAGAVTDGASNDAVTATDDGGGDAATPTLPAPTITTIMKMGGALHVSWSLNASGLSGVEVWRKKDAGTYALAYTLSGTTTSQMDSKATAPGTYCYQVVNLQGGVTSDKSPEKCATP